MKKERIMMGSRERQREIKKEAESLEKYFNNPIIYREIHGDKVFIPLNLNKVWGKIE